MSYTRFRESLRERLQHTAAPENPIAAVRELAGGDLPPELRGFLPERILPAAVLIALMDRTEGAGILLTERTAHLAQHAGQVSFPGGRVEAQDVSLLDCALRETQEETGIPRDAVTPLGYLDVYLTRTGFAVTPVVALVDPGVSLRPDPFEVAEIFELPLAVALDPERYRLESREFHGRQVHFRVLEHDGHYVWGATAAMLYAFQHYANQSQPFASAV